MVLLKADRSGRNLVVWKGTMLEIKWVDSLADGMVVLMGGRREELTAWLSADRMDC